MRAGSRSWPGVLAHPPRNASTERGCSAKGSSRLRGVAQSGSAPALGAGGPGFESRRPDMALRKRPSVNCDGWGDSFCDQLKLTGASAPQVPRYIT
jgi:hypothetical protein